MTSYALLFTLAAIGISETVYLIRKRIASEKPICPIGDSCALVLTSKYNKIFFIHNDVLGLLFYAVALAITGLVVIGLGPLALWTVILKLSVAAAALSSLLFTFLQWRVLKAWCFWCVMSACTIWLMAIIILISHFI